MAKQAKDTFTADLKDGTQRFVTKGEVLPDSHDLVKMAPDLFAEFDLGEGDKKPAAKPAPAAKGASK